MNKQKTHLSRQKKAIVIFAALAAFLAVVYLLTFLLSHEQTQTVLKYDRDGDEVFAIISDVSGKDRGINITYLKNVLSGQAENRYHVKPGKTEDVLCTFEADDIKISYYPMIFPEISLSMLDYVTVTNDYGYFKVYTDPSSGDPIIEQAKSNLYNSNNLSNLLLQSRYMLATIKLENPSSNLADYGLSEKDNPITITVADKKGVSHTVLMGDVSPDGGYYMKHKDKDCIYIMDSAAAVFENDIHYYLSPVLTRSIQGDYAMYIQSLTYIKQGEELFTCEIIPDEERVGTLKNQLHRIISPEKNKQDILSTTTLYEMFTNLCSLSGVAVVEYNVSLREDYEEVMERYGFHEPYASVEYTFGENSYYAVFGDRIQDAETGEVYYYGYGPYMDTIVLVSLADAPFLEYEYLDFIHNKMFQHNIDDVAKITLTNNSGSRVFVTQNTGKDLYVTEQNTGKEIHVPSFRQFYFALLSAGVDGYSQLDAGVNTETLEHNLTFEIQLKTGETLKYAFYSESTLRCYTVINGVGEFYTKREYVDRIARFADMLMSGEVIESQT